MTVHRLETRQTFPVSLAEAWDFFSDPRNLPLITPPWLRLRITCDLPDHMHPGLIISYTVRPVGDLTLSWLTEITHLVEGELFVDEQRVGPYKLWHHQHHFTAVAGGTEVRDVVHYALGFGPIGDLVASRLVQPRLRQVFDYRRDVLTRRLGPEVNSESGPSPGHLPG